MLRAFPVGQFRVGQAVDGVDLAGRGPAGEFVDARLGDEQLAGLLVEPFVRLRARRPPPCTPASPVNAMSYSPGSGLSSSYSMPVTPSASLAASSVTPARSVPPPASPWTGRPPRHARPPTVPRSWSQYAAACASSHDPPRATAAIAGRYGSDRQRARLPRRRHGRQILLRQVLAHRRLADMRLPRNRRDGLPVPPQTTDRLYLGHASHNPSRSFPAEIQAPSS